MLQHSFRLAERWSKKGKLPKEETGRYLAVLEGFACEVQAGAEAGTLTRADDYTMNEFADPLYVADYLKELKQKWERL